MSGHHATHHRWLFSPVCSPGSTWSRERARWALLRKAGPAARCCGFEPSSSNLWSCCSSWSGPHRAGPQISSPSRADERVHCRILLLNLQTDGTIKKKKNKWVSTKSKSKHGESNLVEIKVLQSIQSLKKMLRYLVLFSWCLAPQSLQEVDLKKKKKS